MMATASVLNSSETKLGSVDDINLDQFLKISNYEDTIRQLDIYYGIVKRQLLRHQSPTTGLFPILSSDQLVGSVRDSVYCAAAVWSLYQAYRRIDDDRGKSYELGQCAVKCMRGILECWIKQADRVEKFKGQQCNHYALHCKFHLGTGEALYLDEEYHHLQIDVVSIYLIFLVQMITAGLQIVYTQDEVAFVQNLVYYVERAYRTPDFGMWERGTKYNNGTPEIHASSIGMAKSALEAINGCNLFGEKGASWSVIYVDIDAHNRNRSIFETMLPRESSSKGVDCSLLPTLSFPAFASHEESLVNQTKENIILRLKGKRGFKRFSRDGFKCPTEDPKRRYYKEGEIKEFEGVECEWPLFFCFMLVDGVFRSNQTQIQEYQKLLHQNIERDEHGDPIIPWYYKNVSTPGGKNHWVRNDVNDGLFMWGQSMYLISQLLTTGLLHINELDPIRRYLPSYNRPRRGGRYSAFQGTATDLVVQIVLIAESMRLQAMMATYGIQTQTPHEVEPVQVWSSTQLVQVYQQLGVNSKLGLTGRPQRPVGSLGTSKVYRVCGMTVLCYPLIFEVSDFYLYRDMALLIDDIKTELQFVGRYWRLSGRPTVCLLIREEHMRDPQFKEMLDLLAMLKKGYCDGMKVRIGRLQNLISSSCTEHLDFMNPNDLPEGCETHFNQLNHEYIGYQSLTDVPKAMPYKQDNVSYLEYLNKPIWEVLDVLQKTDSIMAQCQLYGVLLKRQGGEYEVNGIKVHAALTSLYHKAGCLRYWRAVRYCSSLLNHTVDSISPFITTVLVNGKQITVGVIGQKETVFDKPMTPAEISSVMYHTIQPYDVTQAVLQQEVVLYCGRLIATNPDMFKGILKIRVGWVLQAMKRYLEISAGHISSTTNLPSPTFKRAKTSPDIFKDVSKNTIDNHSPYEVRQLLHKVLTVREWSSKEKLTPLQQRQLEGCLCRVPHHFYNKVWDVMERTPCGIIVQGHAIPQQPTLSNMSRSELSFALLVEQMLNHINQPEYRQIVVELLCIASTILSRNPELSFKKALDLDEIVTDAFNMYCKDNLIKPIGSDMTPMFSASYELTTGYFARAVVNSVLQGGAVTGPHNNTDSCQVS